MSRLFWKFFACFLLAQLLTTGVVVAFIWFKDAPHLQGLPIASPETISPSHEAFRSILPAPKPPSKFPLRPIVIGALTSLIFAYFLARYFSKPILTLRHGFGEIGAGNFDVSVEARMKGRKDELADLGHDFDQTAVKLKSLMDSQKRLLNDVSHEVRSPLARMQLAIDLLERQPEKTSELIQRISRESTRINSLIDQVLDLARLETYAQWHIDERINLKELIEIIVDDVAFEAAEKDCKVICRIPLSEANSLEVKGNYELLHRAVENVLRNAIRFTKPNTVVEIELYDCRTDWEISVIDHGPGVSDDKLAQIFQPFDRAGDFSGQGYGLGLAIVAQTLKIHGGMATANNVGSSGLRVALRLPKG